MRVADLSFVGTEDGWALGTRPCGNSTCRALARTTDGARTWHAITAPPQPTQHLRFADPSVGYAFTTTRLFMTTDGGRTWQRQSGGADQLEILNGTVIRVTDGGGCPPGCRYRIERAAVGSSSWHPVRAWTGGAGDGVELARTGHDVYVADHGHTAGGALNARTTLDISHDDGTTWTQHHDPCPTSARNEVDLVALTTAPDGTVAGLCRQRAAGGRALLLTSSDGGASFHIANRRALGSADVALIAAASAQDLFADSDELYRSTDGGNHFGRVAGPAQPSFLGFETARVGRALTGSDTVWTTRDGGATWSRSSV